MIHVNSSDILASNDDLSDETTGFLSKEEKPKGNSKERKVVLARWQVNDGESKLRSVSRPSQTTKTKNSIPYSSCKSVKINLLKFLFNNVYFF